jgi:GTP pyrophosphokinase
MQHQPLSPEISSPMLAAAEAYLREQGAGRVLPSGEPVVEHGLGTARIVASLNVDEATQVAAMLFPAALNLTDNERPLTEAFGAEVAHLVADVGKLLRLGVFGALAASDAAHGGRDAQSERREQVEALRKMLLAFAQDIRVVLIRLAARLESLRFYAATRQNPPARLPRETLEIFAPLANRLGIWQLKWELEDLAFRFEDPETYKRIARMLDEKRVEREGFVTGAIARFERELSAAGIKAEVSGRPKHIYSIWRKMRGKNIDFADLYDVRAFRVIVADVRECYTVLGIVHNIWQPVPREFDDYISRPKPNGYKSLHTVVLDDDGRPLEVQIRTEEMHRFAEFGFAAHWRYKEAGTKGYAGQFSAGDKYDEKIAWLRQLLAWRSDVAHDGESGGQWDQLKQASLADDHIYVMTPQARVIPLPQGSTPVDFAYHLHTELGHRCRGARIDGAMAPLNTPLANGQTVEIVTVRQGGPSRDWLNPQLGYLHSPRAKAKVRAWFNTVDLQESINAGRAIVEKILQREGRTALSLDELATRLGYRAPEDMFVVAGKEELSARQIEMALSDAPAGVPPEATPEMVARKTSGQNVSLGASSGVLVLGVGALMTQMARCCRPAPPDDIVGFVTRGRGVSIHRSTCPSFQHIAARSPERVLQTAWSADVLAGQGDSVYPVDLAIEALDRRGLLRDISEVFARLKINVIGVKTQSRRNVAYMHFTIEVESGAEVQRATAALAEVPGVSSARRRV